MAHICCRRARRHARLLALAVIDVLRAAPECRCVELCASCESALSCDSPFGSSRFPRREACGPTRDRPAGQGGRCRVVSRAVRPAVRLAIDLLGREGGAVLPRVNEVFRPRPPPGGQHADVHRHGLLARGRTYKARRHVVYGSSRTWVGIAHGRRGGLVYQVGDLVPQCPSTR